LTISAKPVGRGAASQTWIPPRSRSGLLTRFRHGFDIHHASCYNSSVPKPHDQKSKTSDSRKSALAPASPSPATTDSGVTLGWLSHRRIVEDLSDSLAKNWRFKWQVCGIVILLSVAILSGITLVVGGRLIDAGINVA